MDGNSPKRTVFKNSPRKRDEGEESDGYKSSGSPHSRDLGSRKGAKLEFETEE
jgi:hypothetical protein